MKAEEQDENILDLFSLRELFHFEHFSHFYRLYVPAAIIIGIVCGIFMILFQLLINLSLYAFSGIPIFIAPLIGGLFSGLMIYKGRTEISGSGISTAIEMTHDPGEMKNSTALTKMLATSISIGTGNPVGREGPAVLIGATIGNAVGRRVGYHDPSFLRVFLMMGSAAATAGIYKAPLGGALFATEAPYRRDARLGYFVPTVLAALTSYLVFALVMGIDPILSFDANFTLTMAYVPYLLVFGVIAGLVSIFFAAVLMVSRNYFDIKLPDWADPIAGSSLACVLIFITGLFLSDNLTIAGLGFDVGIDVIDLVASTSIPLIALIALLVGKLFASSFVVGGKVSGGVLASSIFVGAMLGRIFGDIFLPAASTAFVVLGMGAVLAANTNTPVATTVLILEMSHSFDLVIPLVLCVCISYLVSGGSSLYEGQKVCRDDEDPGYYPSINILPDFEPGLDADASNPMETDNEPKESSESEDGDELT